VSIRLQPSPPRRVRVAVETEDFISASDLAENLRSFGARTEPANGLYEVVGGVDPSDRAAFRELLSTIASWAEGFGRTQTPVRVGGTRCVLRTQSLQWIDL
jgi:hypothetical protein